MHLEGIAYNVPRAVLTHNKRIAVACATINPNGNAFTLCPTDQVLIVLSIGNNG